MRRADPVAVTGMGLITAAGNTLPDCLDSLAQGKVEVTPPPFASAFSFPVFLCPLDTPNIAGLPPIYSRTTAFALRAARDALAAAGLSPEDFSERRSGIAVGTSVGASLDFFDCYASFMRGDELLPDDIERYLASNPAPALGRVLRCQGPVQSVTNACSSGADAIGMAAEWIRSGLCDLVLAGGADALSPITYAGFSSLRLPSPTACRPFDASRSGLTLGEGAGVMLLESEASRKKRGVKALAFIAGYGTATDAHHLTAPHPEGRGLAAAVRQAFGQSGATWKDVAFINAHGTATQANDAAEGAFFKAHCPNVPFVATKGGTGHTLGAAGAVEAVLTAAHLTDGQLPASPGFSEPDAGMGVAPVSHPTNVQGMWALSQSLAFGGNNSVLLIARGNS